MARIIAGRYEVLGELGRGGMGVVYRVRDTRLDRIVALKGTSPLSEEDAARFQREARMAAGLSHPHIVKVYDVETVGEECFLTMDYVEGRNLGAATLERRRAVEVIQKVAEALHYAHEQGIIHRDVKPENILLDAADRPFLTDFGLARPVAGSKLTVSGAILGTPAYMSPEQARGRAVDRRTDVYSLGATLYEALAGRAPFEGQDTIDVLARVCSQDAPSLRRLNPNIHSDLETIVSKCLEKEPDRRYATARDLAEDLGRWLAGEPIQARPVSRLGRMIRWVRRHRVVSAFSAALVLLALAATVPLFGPGRLRVASDPPGARVYVDGKFVGTTPLRTPLLWPPGRRVLEFELEGFERQTIPTEVRPLAAVDARAGLRHQQGRLRLSTTLEAMTVTIRTPDGRHVLTTAAPVENIPIDTGRYVLRASRAHYFDRTVEVEIRANRETHEHLSLESAVAWSQPLPGTKAYILCLADLNRDGILDVVTQCTDFRLHVLDGQTGRDLGSVPYGAPHPAATTFDVDGDGWEDLVRIAPDHSLVALSWEDQRVLWTWRPEGEVTYEGLARCDLGGRTILVLGRATPPGVSAIDASTGRELWRRTTPGGAWFAVPIDAGGDGRMDIVAVDSSGKLVALDAESGEPRWTFDGKSRFRTFPAIGRLDDDAVDDIAIGCDGRVVFGVSGRDGTLLWREEMAGPSVGLGDLDGDGRPEILAVNADHLLTALDGKTRRPLWTVDQIVSWSVPVTADLDGDGRPEVISGSRGLTVVSADGRQVLRHLEDENVLRPPLVADLDGDGILEVVAGTEEGRVTVFRGRPTGLLWVVRAGFDGGANGQPGSECLVVDVDRDGRPEVAAAGNRMASLLDGASGRVRWTIEMRDFLTTPFLTADADGDGVIDFITAHGAGEVLALSGRDGGTIWSQPWVSPNYYHLLAADLDGDGKPEGLLVTRALRDGRAIAFDLAGGAKRWEAGFPVFGLPRPCLIDADGDGRTDVVVSTYRHLLAYSGRDGSRLWEAATDPPPQLEMLAWDHDGDGRAELAYVTSDGIVVVRDPKSGVLLWSVPLGERMTGLPTLADLDGDGVAELLFGTYACKYVAFSGKRRAPLWTFRAKDAFHEGGQALHDFDGDGTADIVVGNKDRFLRILSGRTGRELWKRDAGVGTGRTRPVVADLDGDGRLEILINTADRLTRAWTVDFARSPPVYWVRPDVRGEGRARRGP